MAEFPIVIAAVKRGDGSIIATEEQGGSTFMPKDTITLCGMFSVSAYDLTDDAQIFFDADYSELIKGTSSFETIKTTDFVITNVMEQNGDDEVYITGEITNNYFEDIERGKHGEIVYMDNTYVENLRVGKVKAFEFQEYGELPEHDTIDVSAMAW